jgi:hypothetical protein
MIAYVFVYNSSSFKVIGEHPLKAFQPGQSYAQMNPIISEGAEKMFDHGIYAIWSDAPDVSEQLITQSSITSDYDLYFVQVTDKDGWPWLIDERSKADPALRTRVRNAFPDLTDQDLMLYFDPRRVFAA